MEKRKEPDLSVDSQDKLPYEQPQVSDLGTVGDMTQTSESIYY